MGINDDDPVLYPGFRDGFLHLIGDIVEAYRAVIRLYLEFLFEYHITPHFFRSSAARLVAAIISSIIATGSFAFMMPEAAPAASDPAMMKSYTC